MQCRQNLQSSDMQTTICHAIESHQYVGVTLLNTYHSLHACASVSDLGTPNPLLLYREAEVL